MELIRYRKTLDVHKNGSQFMLQGFQTADNMSRVIEISLMASGDAIDFPLEKVEALMYVTTPNATEPSINECTIKDNKVVYDVLPIVEEGITTMQLKIIETSTEGATGILACPKFSVEVTKSGVDDGKAEQTTTYTALENAMAKAKAVYDERFLRMELTSDCIFKAYYADGTVYETDLLKKLFLNGNVLLSESFAHGGTGVRAGEDTDNSMYYSNVSKSEALNAKNIMENSEEILEEVKLHGVYTAFNVDFETGEVEYVSPSFKFKIDLESGELDVIGQNYTFDNEVGRIVEEWLLANKIVLSDLQAISKTHTTEIGELKTLTKTHTTEIGTLKERITPIGKGGTGATTAEDALANLGAAAIDLSNVPYDVLKNINKHYWKRQKVELSTQLATSTQEISMYEVTSSGPYKTFPFYYSENIELSIDYDAQASKVTLKNPQFQAYNTESYKIYTGKYISLNSDGSSPIYYVESVTQKAHNATVTYFTVTARQVLAGITTLNDIEYVYSESIDTFPNGLFNNYLYEYKGIIEENILNGFKAPWETLYAGTVVLNTLTDLPDGNETQMASLHKFDDYEVASKYSVFRVVIKKCSSFYCKAGSYTNGYVGSAGVAVTATGVDKLLTITCSPDGSSSNYIDNEYQLVLDEDIISKDIARNDVITRNITIYDGASGVYKESYDDIKSCNLWVKVTASRSKGHATSDVARTSLTFEIQGRRD